MAIQSGDSEDLVSDINVTPLVDVMLVLLVVFIITAPLIGNAVKVQLPQTQTTSRPEPTPAITVSVDDHGLIYLDRIETKLEAVKAEIERRRAGKTDLAVHLSADQSSHYGLVAKVMSSINRAGVTKLSVLSAGE